MPVQVDAGLTLCSPSANDSENTWHSISGPGEKSVDLDQVVLTIQRFSRRWPDVKRFPGEAERAAGDADGGFERLLRANLEAIGAPGDVALARELHFHDGRDGAIVPQHEHDLVMRLVDGICVVEAKAWTEVVDKGPVIVFLAEFGFGPFR